MCIDFMMTYKKIMSDDNNSKKLLYSSQILGLMISKYSRFIRYDSKNKIFEQLKNVSKNTNHDKGGHSRSHFPNV